MARTTIEQRRAALLEKQRQLDAELAELKRAAAQAEKAERAATRRKQQRDDRRRAEILGATLLQARTSHPDLYRDVARLVLARERLAADDRELFADVDLPATTAAPHTTPPAKPAPASVEPVPA